MIKTTTTDNYRIELLLEALLDANNSHTETHILEQLQRAGVVDPDGERDATIIGWIIPDPLFDDNGEPLDEQPRCIPIYFTIQED